MLYVSLGTQARLSDTQMEDTAWGLELVEDPFIWVMKSRTWSTPVEWEERVKGRGFLSHCGWNSVLESLSMLAWPLGAVQPFNGKVVERLGARMRILEVVGEGTGIVGTEIICDRVKEMMEGKEGRKTRERGMELKRMTREAMKKGESSDRNLDELIECLARGKDRHVK